MKPSFDNSAVKQRMDQMVSKLRQRHFRLTPQRLAILRVVAASEGHPSVERIYETVRREFPMTGMATIYKTVHLLNQIHEVLEMALPGGSNRYDGNKPFPHPHVICVRCRKIIDSNLESLKDMTAEAAHETGFDMLTYRLDFLASAVTVKEKKTNRPKKKEA